MDHKFFKKVDWVKLEKKIGLKPPIKPKQSISSKISKAEVLEMQDEALDTPPNGFRRKETVNTLEKKRQSKLELFR
jgi:hypothetical protein